MNSARLLERPELSPYSLMRTPARASWMIASDSADALVETLARPPLLGLPRLVLGEGSNVLFVRDFPGVVVRLQTLGLWWQDQGETVLVRAAAGVRWDDLVSESVRRGLWGLENLAAIPGTVGAAPIQNIGAYGCELVEVLESVELIDLDSGDRSLLDTGQCAFGYRTSRFRSPSGQKRWLIEAIRLRLSRSPRPRLDYPGLRESLRALGGEEHDPAAIATAVAQLRRSRLPDPAREPNLGSFFKNPTIPAADFAALRRELPALPGWPQPCGMIKVPAAALIEAAGLKGLRGRNCRVSERHALVIVNDGLAQGAEVLALARLVRERVLARFAIALEPEPAIVGEEWP